MDFVVLNGRAEKPPNHYIFTLKMKIAMFVEKFHNSSTFDADHHRKPKLHCYISLSPVIQNLLKYMSRLNRLVT
jgi:hypothetical protein